MNQNDQPQRIDDEHDAFEDQTIEAEMILLAITSLLVAAAIIVCGWLWPQPTVLVIGGALLGFWLLVIVRMLRA